MKQDNMDSPFFRNLGGSLQYSIDTPEDLKRVPELDPALFAALSAPVSAIAADPDFLACLDSDGNGVIRLDELKNAVRFLFSQLKDTQNIVRREPHLSPGDLRSGVLADFVRSYPGLLAGGEVRLEAIREAIAALTAGPLKGDGVITAVENSALFSDVLKVSGGTAGKGGLGITEAQLDAFLAEAKCFLDWSRNTPKPLFRGEDPVEYGNCYLALKPKIEEYFRFCELVALDPAHARRFSMDPAAALPALDLTDSGAVEKLLSSAPCAVPAPDGVLDLGKKLNPHYEDALHSFGELFGITTLTRNSFAALGQELAPYMEYLSRTQCETVKTLGMERLEADLAPEQEARLRELFVQDGALGVTFSSLQDLKKLILFQQHLLSFCNDFVSFRGLFRPDTGSLIKAGHLVLDGRHFDLTVYARNTAEHKKIAMQSRLCILYLELDADAKVPCRNIAAAVTAGDLTRLYVGKLALFFLPDGSCCNARITDIVEGPIDFWQTLFAPFRRLGSAVGNKIRKVTDFSSLDKKVEEKLSGTPPCTPAPQKSGFFTNPMLLLAGGVSVAAVSAAAGFVLKTCVGIMESLSAMKWSSLLLWILAIVLLFFLPAALNTFLKLRARNLTLFLEASGWALNLPMRLSASVSHLFTHGGEYPANSRFCRIDITEIRPVSVKRSRKFLSAALILLLLLAGWYFLVCRQGWRIILPC